MRVNHRGSSTSVGHAVRFRRPSSVVCRPSALLAVLLAATLPALAGYWRADVNLDGVVDSNDLAIIQANMGYKSPVPNPEVVLTNVLRVTPDRKTILQGETTPLTAPGGTSTVYWTFIRNGSAGTLQTNSPSAAAHTAGLNSSTVDVIQAWDADNNIGRTFLNVIGSNEVAALGKAIIVAGGKQLDDPVWLATDYLADKAFNVLRYRGFSKANINYLSFQPGQDADGNGQLDDIDGYTSLGEVGAAFTNWVGNANKLFVYLADHGSDSSGQGYFRLNGTDHLTATNLDAWLDRIQNTYGTEVTVLMEFCYAGSFLDELAYTGTARRILIAAARSDQPTYFLAGGLISFSDAFWNGILQGMDLAQAFAYARDAMALRQEAQLDDDGNGIANGADGAESAGQYVGATFVAGKNFPVIGQVLGNQLLTEGTEATLYADDIASYYPLERVWCTIIPPSHNPATNTGVPVVDVAEVDLSYDNTAGRHQATYGGFSENGTYQISYYAKDIWQSVSPPRVSQVIQAGYDEKFLLVAGGPTNDADWNSVRSLARSAYNTARVRAFTTNTIQFLSAQDSYDANGDGTNDVNGLATRAAIENVFTNWARDAERLTVYLVGGVSNGQFRISGSETLAPAELDAWADFLQVSNLTINLLLEFDGSGDYLPHLVAPAGRERLVLTSGSAGQPATWHNQGVVSFSQFFLSQVFQGETIGRAFERAREFIRQNTGRLRQTPLCDENGDGQPDAHLALSHNRYFGPAFVTGDDKPSIGSVISNQVVAAPTNLVIWARDVVDVDGISNVWCVITPPDAYGTNGLVEKALTYNAAAGRYEATQALTQAGSYALTFLAVDRTGELSTPSQTLLSGPDAYEVDDTAGQASYMAVGDLKTHTFHSADDEDWIRFYVVTGQPQLITARQTGTNIDLKLDLYWERPDGTLSNMYNDVNDVPDGLNTGEVLAVDTLLYADEFPEGFYLLRVSSANTNLWGVGADYEVKIEIIIGGSSRLIVVAADKLHPGLPPPGAQATVVGVGVLPYGSSTVVTFTNVPAGVHTVLVTTAAGYAKEEDPVAPGQTLNLANELYGNPKLKSVVGEYQIIVFSFVPVATATGQVRDRVTGEYVPDVRVRWQATDGVVAGTIFTQFPQNTAYGSQWVTRAGGGFPSNVILPAVSMNLLMSKAGYSNFTRAGALVTPAAGYATNLGLLYLSPLDTNGNGIADSWEALHFGGAVAATNDPDADGQDNRNEYWLATDPTNAASVFKASGADLTNGLTLRWPVSAGRVYEVRATESLVTGAWPVVAGPWTAAVGQATMQWTGAAPGGTGRYYGVRARLP
jgi:hypothetical protein